MALPAGRKGVLPSELTPEGKIKNAASPYVLPTASADTLGGVKVGSGLAIDSNGVLSSTGSGGSTVITPIDKTDFPYTATETGFVYIFAVGNTTSSLFYENIKLNDTNLLYPNTSAQPFNNKEVSVTIPVKAGDIVSLDGNKAWSAFNAMFIKH